MEALERRETWNHAQGKAEGNLAWICFGVYQPEEANDLLNHNKTSLVY